MREIAATERESRQYSLQFSRCLAMKRKLARQTFTPFQNQKIEQSSSYINYRFFPRDNSLNESGEESRSFR